MTEDVRIEKCRAFIHSHLHPEVGGVLHEPETKPAVTISRMAGSGGGVVAELLAEYLQARNPGECRWTVFDRNLMQKVLEDHHLPVRIAQYYPEAHKPRMDDIVEEMLSKHPSSWSVVQQTVETILRLARVGRVILVGRGANAITCRLKNVFQVRLVGSVERRVERVRRDTGLDKPAAFRFIRIQDEGRRQYLKEHFKKDINDPSLYHLTINTDRFELEEAARLIGDEVLNRFHLHQLSKATAA